MDNTNKSKTNINANDNNANANNNINNNNSGTHGGESKQSVPKRPVKKEEPPKPVNLNDALQNLFQDLVEDDKINVQEDIVQPIALPP